MDDKRLLRYGRQIILPEFGFEKQTLLKNATILVVGIGGLGSPAALYLASSGVGTLILADFDTVELSNLSRQVIHQTQNIGEQKTESAKEKCQQLNPDIIIKTLEKKLSFDELLATCHTADIVLDCTDNFQSRYRINQACFIAKTPLVSGAAVQFSGQLSVFCFNKSATPCYQCLYPDSGEDSELTCADNGILAPVVGTIGVLQALEAIKILTNLGQNLSGKLLIFDGLTTSFRTLNIASDPDCPICTKSSS